MPQLHSFRTKKVFTAEMISYQEQWKRVTRKLELLLDAVSVS